jgi:DNA ligase-1
MQLATLVNASRDVAATRSRLKKRAALRACLEATTPAETGLVVDYLAGHLPQGRIGLGPAILRRLEGGRATAASLTLADVNEAFDTIAAIRGQGSQQARRETLTRLLHKATDAERVFLEKLILGELRQGALEGVLIDAMADTWSLPAADLRRAVMLAGALAPVASAVRSEGESALARFRLEPLSPITPMLAQPAADMAEAIASLGEAALEYKLDGARVQIHRVGRDVRIFSRALNDVTSSLPEIVEAVRAYPADALILDGEVIALSPEGRPQPFQVTMRRFGRKTDVARLRETLPLSVFLFDCLHRDGEDLLDLPGGERFARLKGGADAASLVPRLVTADANQAQAFLLEALARGHEGVMAKSLTSAYAAGSRGADWLKVKQAHTLDLVVLAAEWGSGRRQGWLSNLHLGARDPATGGFVMLGKTFKGLTDRMLASQTRALLELELGREGHVVHVRPERVVEIAVNEIQASSKYPGGLALRFARVKRYRDDKHAGEADTIDTVRGIFERQGAMTPG